MKRLFKRNFLIDYCRVVDPEWFVSDPTPDPTFKEVSAPTPDPTPAIGMVWGNIYGTGT